MKRLMMISIALLLVVATHGLAQGPEEPADEVRSQRMVVHDACDGRPDEPCRGRGTGREEQAAIHERVGIDGDLRILAKTDVGSAAVTPAQAGVYRCLSIHD